MTKTKTIIINKAKNNFILVAFLLLIILLLYTCVLFLKSPSEHTSFYIRSKFGVIIFSISGIILCIILIIFIIRFFFLTKKFLKIDECGIYSGFFPYKKKHINWNEICKIERIEYYNNYYICVFLKDVRNNEKGFYSLNFETNKKMFGTPYIIVPRNYECTFEELERVIMDSFNEYKQIENNTDLLK